jgi:hypothetical protein
LSSMYARLPPPPLELAVLVLKPSVFTHQTELPSCSRPGRRRSRARRFQPSSTDFRAGSERRATTGDGERGARTILPLSLSSMYARLPPPPLELAVLVLKPSVFTHLYREDAVLTTCAATPRKAPTSSLRAREATREVHLAAQFEQYVRATSAAASRASRACAETVRFHPSD